MLKQYTLYGLERHHMLQDICNFHLTDHLLEALGGSGTLMLSSC